MITILIAEYLGQLGVNSAVVFRIDHQCDQSLEIAGLRSAVDLFLDTEAGEETFAANEGSCNWGDCALDLSKIVPFLPPQASSVEVHDEFVFRADHDKILNQKVNTTFPG